MAAPDLYPDADWLAISPLAGRVGLRLTGEADLHTVPALRAALAQLPPDTAEIYLDLAGLEFIDVASARQVAALAERPAQPRITLHDPPPNLIWLIHLLWPESQARFSVLAERADLG